MGYYKKSIRGEYSFCEFIYFIRFAFLSSPLFLLSPPFYQVAFIVCLFYIFLIKMGHLLDRISHISPGGCIKNEAN